MEKIKQLRATPKKELSGIQLIRTFIERQIQPLSARTHCMWDYTDRQDSTRISPDELKESKIDDGVRAVTKLKKKSIMPKVFGIAAFSKLNPRTEVLLSWTTSICFDFDAYFRSSTEETLASLGDCDRFQIRPHDSTHEQTTDLQEKEAVDATPGDLPKSSPPPKKSTVEPDLILVSSFGEPSGPKHHVSPKILAL
jgi:hypothetical protein